MSIRLALLAIAVGLALCAVPVARVQADDEPYIVAESAIVIDAGTGEVLFERNAMEARAPASLTKLFTALVALETMPLDTAIVVEPADLVGEASMGLVAGDVVRLETMLHGLMLPSGNDAAAAVARTVGGGSEAAFMARVNQRVDELGLRQTHLVNPHGLDAEGHYSSARDVAAVAMYALQTQPALANAIHTPSYTGDGYTLYNTNRLLNIYPGLIGGKTGVTDAAGYCLMQIAEIDGRRVLVVLMGSTWESWYADAERLLDYGFVTLAVPGRLTGTDAIVFPQPVTQVVAAGVTRVETGLDVVEGAADTRVVSMPRLAADGGWSPWFWIGAVVVLVPSVTFIAVQTQKLLALMAYGPPRRRPATRPRARPARAVAPETQRFPLVVAASPPQVAHERWAVREEAATRHARGERSREAVPSFASD